MLVNVDRIIKVSWAMVFCHFQRFREKQNYLEHSVYIQRRREENSPPVQQPVIDGKRSKRKRATSS